MHCVILQFVEIPLTNRVRGVFCKLRTEVFPARAINQRGKNKDPKLSVRTEKTRLVTYLLYI